MGVPLQLFLHASRLNLTSDPLALLSFGAQDEGCLRLSDLSCKRSMWSLFGLLLEQRFRLQLSCG